MLRKLVRLGKGGTECMVPKTKTYLSKKYKKFHGIAAKKLSCIDKKVWKNGNQMKSFQSCWKLKIVCNTRVCLDPKLKIMARLLLL